jgi:hypothetical protein
VQDDQLLAEEEVLGSESRAGRKKIEDRGQEVA